MPNSVQPLLWNGPYDPQIDAWLRQMVETIQEEGLPDHIRAQLDALRKKGQDDVTK